MRGRVGAAVRRRTGIAGVVGLVAVLAACTGGGAAAGPAAPTTPTPTVSPSATPSPVPSPPPRPAAPTPPVAMGEATTAGAEATARHFFDVFDYAFATGDSALLTDMARSTCGYCGEVVRQVEQAAADGLLTERDASEITDVRVIEVRPAEWFTVELSRRQGVIRLRGDDGVVIASEPAGEPLPYGLALSWDGRRWWVDEVGLTAASP